MTEDQVLKEWIDNVKGFIESGYYEPDIADVKMLIRQAERLMGGQE